MPYDEILCFWLVRSALLSLVILLVGSAAVLVWRQPARRVRIIELVLAGCLITPWLGMIPGYPQLAVVWWHAAAIKQPEAPLPPSVDPIIEPATAEPMPFPVADLDTPPVPGTKTVEAPVHAFEIRPWIIAVYLVGVAFGAGWWLVGLVGLVRILWTSQPAPSRCRELLTEISGGCAARVRLLVSRRLSQPFASAWGRAVIVLPENLCGDEQSLRWCLAHEWAHVDRHDFRTWLLAGLARVLFFYQPLLWWLRRQLRLCQDFVADAQAALQARQVEDYAEFLTARAATGKLHPALGLSMGSGRSELYRRVIMLLKNQPLESRTPRLWTVSVTVAALVLVAVVAAVSLMPRAVAEEKRVTSASEASPANNRSAAESKAGSKPAPTDRLVVDSNTEQAKAIAEIEKLGGKVTLDKNSPRRPVIAVDLQRTKVTDAGLELLKGFNQLQSLELYDTQITDAGLARLERLSHLHDLSLSLTKVTDAGLVHLEGLSQFHDLQLSQTEVTDAGLIHLQKLTQLQSLNLSLTKITDAGLVHLEGLKQLQSLKLAAIQLTDAGLEHLKGLTRLQTLSLVGAKISDTGLGNLERLTQLQSLSLAFTPVTDAGLVHLEGLSRLQTLMLAGTTLTDAGLVHLKGLTRLQSLVIACPKVTDAGLVHLERLTQLQALNLYDTQVTGAGLVHLKRLTQLQTLYLFGTGAVFPFGQKPGEDGGFERRTALCYAKEDLSKICREHKAGGFLSGRSVFLGYAAGTWY